MKNLLSIHFWFNVRPPQLTPLSQYLLIGLVILFLGSAIFFFFKKRKKGTKKNFYLEIWRNLYTFCLTNAILGSLFLFFNYQMIPFFSSRFWYVVWFLVMVTWIFFIIKKLKTVPEKIKQAEQQEKYKKYLPK